MMQSLQTIPQFPARNLNETRRFYESLGFTCPLQIEGDDLFLMLCDGPVELHFWQYTAVTPEESIMSCYIRFSELREFTETQQRWAKAGLPDEGIPRLTAPVDRPWGMTEFYLVDPEGTLIKCGMDTPETGEPT